MLNFKKIKGFTLLETVISIAIFSLVIGLVSLFARDIFYYGSIFSGGLSAYDESKKVLQPIASEIRSSSPSSLGSYPIETATDNSFIFFADINSDGLKERIRYFLSGTTFKKGVITPTGNPLLYIVNNEVITDVVHNIKNNGTPIFNYYNTSYNGNTASLAQPVMVIEIRLIRITLIIDTDPNRSPVPVTVSTQINLRNLKDNL